jgi:hypothetical protein
MVQWIRRSLGLSPFLRSSVRISRMVHVSKLPGPRYCEGATMPSVAMTMDKLGAVLSRFLHKLKHKSSLNLSRLVILSVRKVCVSLWQFAKRHATVASSYFARICSRRLGSLLFARKKKILDTSSSRGYHSSLWKRSTELPQASAYGSKYLDLCFSLGFLPGAGFTIDEVSSRKSSTEWNSLRLILRPTAYLPIQSPCSSP